MRRPVGEPAQSQQKETDTDQNTDAIGEPVEYISKAGCRQRALQDFNERAVQQKANENEPDAMREGTASDARQTCESQGVLRLVPELDDLRNRGRRNQGEDRYECEARKEDLWKVAKERFHQTRLFAISTVGELPEKC